MDKVQQASIEYLLHIKNEAQKFPIKPYDALVYAEAMRKICETLTMLSINDRNKASDKKEDKNESTRQ